MLAIHRILHPTDFSDLSRPAFEFACSLARDYGAELVVCYVIPPPPVTVVDGMTIAVPIDQPTNTLEELREVRPSDPRIAVVHRLEQGDPAREIIELASNLRVELIVMGTHGRGGLARVLVGSVAEAVMRKAPCPVVTLKTPFPNDSPTPE